MTAPTLYKVLHPDRFAFHGGLGTWPAPGEWIEVAGPLVPCQNGLHLCRERDLVRWLGPAIWTAEHEGEIVECDDKIVVRRARLVRRIETWTPRTARLLAADCAERALPIFERAHPNDARPRKAIEAARAFARGEIDASTFASYVAAAAFSAAGYAVMAAARDAARAAARAAALAAAWDAETRWQTARLMQYLRGEVV